MLQLNCYLTGDYRNAVTQNAWCATRWKKCQSPFQVAFSGLIRQKIQENHGLQYNVKNLRWLQDLNSANEMVVDWLSQVSISVSAWCLQVMQLRLCVHQCGFAGTVWEWDPSSESVFWVCVLGRGIPCIIHYPRNIWHTEATQADATFAEHRDEVI